MAPRVLATFPVLQERESYSHLWELGVSPCPLRLFPAWQAFSPRVGFGSLLLVLLSPTTKAAVGDPGPSSRSFGLRPRSFGPWDALQEISAGQVEAGAAVGHPGGGGARGGSGRLGAAWGGSGRLGVAPGAWGNKVKACWCFIFGDGFKCGSRNLE